MLERVDTDGAGRNGSAPGSREEAERRRGRAQVSVVIPAKNEAENVGWVLERIPDCVDEIVLVDGNSTDGTVEVARRVRPEIRVIPEEQPGKGAALRTGFAAARGDFIVMIDADGSMDPREIDVCLERLHDRRNGTGPDGHDERYEFVKGSRFTSGGGTSDMTAFRRAGNSVLLWLTNLLYGTEFTDLCYGLCAFRRDVLLRMQPEADGFEVEAQLIARAVTTGARVGEIPSFESPRICGDSNLNPVRDGTRVLRTLLRERARARSSAAVSARAA
jgi:glycosyltransferase involved in cell wall biosynthesis